MLCSGFSLLVSNILFIICNVLILVVMFEGSKPSSPHNIESTMS